MNRVYWQAAGLLGLSAVISLVLWLNGFPPEWDTDKGETVSAVRNFLTTPFAIVGVGTGLTLLQLLFKRGALNTSGKARSIVVMSVLFMPILTLFLQVMMPLALYDLVGSGGLEMAFLFLVAAFFVIMGNYVVTAPYQSRIGLRNKWTLADPMVWARTHRFFGRSLVIGILLTLPACLIINGEYATYGLVGMALLLKSVAWLYARSLSQRLALRNT